MNPEDSLLFGTLRSEFDSPQELGTAFTDYEKAFTALVDAYRYGLLAAEPVAQTLSRMRIEDHNGLHWTLGATTLRWYRRIPGGAWRSAAPPNGEDSGRAVETSTASVQEAEATLRTISGPAPSPQPPSDNTSTEPSSSNDFFS